MTFGRWFLVALEGGLFISGVVSCLVTKDPGWLAGYTMVIVTVALFYAIGTST